MTVSDKKAMDESIRREKALALDWAIDMLDQIEDRAALRKRLVEKKLEYRAESIEERD